MAWETSSGLIEEYVGTVAESWFDTDLNYQDGEALLLHWLITDLEADEPLGTDETTEKFSVGGGWAAVENGRRAEKQYGKKDFNENSKYGRIIERVVHDEAFKGAMDVLEDRGDEKDAAVWEGLRFKFARETVDYGGEIGERTFIMPVEFLGVADDVSAPTSNGPGTEASRDELEEALTELAQSVDSHTEFVAEAADVEGVVEDDELFESVADESDEGFYANATA